MSWLDDFKGAFTELPGDIRSAAGKTNDVVRNDNDRDFNMKRRNFIQLAGAAAVGAGVDYGEDGDFDSVDAVGDAYGAMVERIPDSPVDIDVKYTGPDPFGLGPDGGSGANTTDSGSGANTTTDSGVDTNTTTDTSTDTTTDAPTDTTTDIDLPYDGILDGLGDQTGSTAEAFQDYTLTALDANLEGVGLEEAVNNSDDYEASIMDALEGTYADGDAFNVGDYAEIGIQEDLGANDTFKTYLNEADNEGVLEDEIQDYLGEMEVSWN